MKAEKLTDRELLTSGNVGRSLPLEMGKDIPASTGVNDPDIVERSIPFTGRIIIYHPGYPDGAENRLGIGLWLNEEVQLYPYNSEDAYVGYDDVSEPLPIRYPVRQDDTVQTFYVNNDTANSHFGNSLVMIEEVFAGEMH